VPVDVSPLVHIEMAVRDADAAAAFLARVFGAPRVREEASRFLAEALPGYKVVYVELGGVVLQFVQPPPGDNPWAEHLRTKGPGVHNLTFRVADVAEAAAALAREGAPTLLEIDLDWAKLFGADNVREHVPPVHIIGGENVIGFRLELYEEARTA